MSMRTSEVTDSKALQTTPTDEAHTEVFPPEQPQALAQARRVSRISLPEQELRRRLWRLYDMALAAANRTEKADEV